MKWLILTTTWLLLSGCTTDNLVASGMILGGVAIGGVGYLLGSHPDIEIPPKESAIEIELGKTQTIHFQLRVPTNTSLDQEIHISAVPADMIEIQNPVINISQSIADLPVQTGEEPNTLRFWNKSLPVVKGLKLGEAKIRIEAMGTTREVKVQIIPVVPEPS